MSFDTYWRFILALAFVVVLIALCAWVARRLGFAGRFATTGGQRRLAVLEVLPIDAKRRLVLVRRDDVEHLILLGMQNDLLLERGHADGFAGLTEGGAP